MSPALYYFCVFALFAFGLGCCVASFLNVCIWRIPRGESVAWPPSHCPRCNAPIKWYQNIPILSWLLLHGRCATCHEPISVRYILVEMLGGILFLMSYLQWGTSVFLGGGEFLSLMPLRSLASVGISYLVFAGLILGSGIDLAEQWLPDRVTLGGMILGVVCSFTVPEYQLLAQGIPLPQTIEFSLRLKALLSSLAGLALGFGSLWSIGWIFSKILKKDAMGFGDVKLIGAIGAFFGPLAVLFTILASSLVGSLVGLFLLVRRKIKLGAGTAVPYGPFLALGVLIWMFWGPPLVRWYLKTLFGLAAQ